MNIEKKILILVVHLFKEWTECVTLVIQGGSYRSCERTAKAWSRSQFYHQERKHSIAHCCTCWTEIGCGSVIRLWSLSELQSSGLFCKMSHCFSSTDMIILSFINSPVKVIVVGFWKVLRLKEKLQAISYFILWNFQSVTFIVNKMEMFMKSFTNQITKQASSSDSCYHMLLKCHKMSP